MDNQINLGQNKFIIRLLNEGDVISSSDLINRVSKEMHSKRKDTYLHNKTPKEIKEYISNADNKMVGIFVLNENDEEEKLVAEMGYLVIDKYSSRDEDGDYLPNFNANAVVNEDIYYVGSVCVDSEFRGNHFFEIMLHFLEDETRESEKTHAVAMVDISNYYSMGVLLDNRYFLAQKTKDPDDKGDIVYLVKNLKKELKTYATSDIELTINEDSYERNLELLTSNGYVGCRFNRENKSIEFVYEISIRKDLGYTDEIRPVINRTVDNGSLEELAYV